MRFPVPGHVRFGHSHSLNGIVPRVWDERDRLICYSLFDMKSGLQKAVLTAAWEHPADCPGTGYASYFDDPVGILGRRNLLH